MTGDLEAFLDTNVLVYALSADEPAKHRRAQEIVEREFVEGCVGFVAVGLAILVAAVLLLIGFRRHGQWVGAVPTGVGATRTAGGIAPTEGRTALTSWRAVRVEV